MGKLNDTEQTILIFLYNNDARDWREIDLRVEMSYFHPSPLYGTLKRIIKKGYVGKTRLDKSHSYEYFITEKGRKYVDVYYQNQKKRFRR